MYKITPHLKGNSPLNAETITIIRAAAAVRSLREPRKNDCRWRLTVVQAAEIKLFRLNVPVNDLDFR
jgi:hypothetical protein